LSAAGLSALFYAPPFGGTDPVLPALQAKGYAVTQPASWAAFNQALSNNVYTPAVAHLQSGAFDDLAASAAALSAHLAAGRAAWLVDWTRSNYPAAAFQGGYAKGQQLNQQPVSISDGDLAAGVTNPLPLSSPGYATWSWGLAASRGAVALASFPDGSPAVVLGNGGRSALLGFTADAVTGQNGQRFFENLLDITAKAPPRHSELPADQLRRQGRDPGERDGDRNRRRRQSGGRVDRLGRRQGERYRLV
jgi:hypothetical protein